MAKILVCEDSKPIALTIQKMLVREGHEVEVVHDGELAYQRACSQLYDLVTMDISMPGVDGEEAICAIEVENPDQKILVVSASKDSALRKTLVEDSPNVVGWLEKPFDWGSLTAAVKAALEPKIEFDS
ncbi:MAG: response regulator [Planctomycetes bacterium]|nr:response regulator [Planctomycetota bacterium]